MIKYKTNFQILTSGKLSLRIIYQDHQAQETLHTVAIWTFTFHKISGFERVILKENFNPLNRQTCIKSQFKHVNSLE